MTFLCADLILTFQPSKAYEWWDETELWTMASPSDKPGNGGGAPEPPDDPPAPIIIPDLPTPTPIRPPDPQRDPPPIKPPDDNPPIEPPPAE